jgi:site-specific DNA-methyltransferase (adenine-specific)
VWGQEKEGQQPEPRKDQNRSGSEDLFGLYATGKMKAFMKCWSLEKYENKVIEGDCLKILAHLPDHSIDMILCDLPYGTTNNLWDEQINLKALWIEYERVVKVNGAILLSAQGAFTGQLIMSNEKMFKYKLVWVKSIATGFLNARRQPLRKHEDICVFYKKPPVYHPQMQAGKPYDPSTASRYGTGSYGDYNYSRKANLTGDRFPTDTIQFSEYELPGDCVWFKTAAGEGKVYHAVQKPVALGRYLIRTYSDVGDLVLDNACGSGSFLISALLEGRRFVGIEKNGGGLIYNGEPVDYIKVCQKRIAEGYRQLQRCKK